MEEWYESFRKQCQVFKYSFRNEIEKQWVNLSMRPAKYECKERRLLTSGWDKNSLLVMFLLFLHGLCHSG